MTNTNVGAWTAYAGLVVSALAHFGWVVQQNDIITIIAGVVTLVGVLMQHYKTNQIIAGIKAGEIKS